MFNFFRKKNNNIEKVVSTQRSSSSVYNGTVYRGVFNIGGIIVEGAYVRDGQRTFVCDEGVANITKGVKITQIQKKEVSNNVEHYLDCLENDYCTPFTFIK